MSRKPYATDLTDDQWERLEPLIPKPKSGTKKGGRPATVDRRAILNAIFYHLRAGGAWELLPHDFPNHKTVFHYFNRWRETGAWERIHARLREEVRLEAEHRQTLPGTRSSLGITRSGAGFRRRGSRF
jgi:putative transposase